MSRLNDLYLQAIEEDQEKEFLDLYDQPIDNDKQKVEGGIENGTKQSSIEEIKNLQA